MSARECAFAGPNGLRFPCRRHDRPRGQGFDPRVTRRIPVWAREDLGQDLIVDLLCCLPAYDPARGSTGVFANIVLRNQPSRFTTRHARQRREQGGALLSLEVPRAGGKEPIGDTTTEDDGLVAWNGQSRCAVVLHIMDGKFAGSESGVGTLENTRTLIVS